MKPARAPSAPEPEGPIPQRIAFLKARLEAEAARGGHPPPRLVLVTKGVDAGRIREALAAGHRLFGENRVQETAAKWPNLRAECSDVELHLVGRLQSNKAEDAVRLFDAIHSLDRASLVAALAKAMDRCGRRPHLFVQVNLGREPQKGGVAPEELAELLAAARAAGLPVIGLMTVPPVYEEPAPFFALLAKLARRHGLAGLSMGMSADWDIAARLGATHVRIGSAVFGARPAG
ncbi:MAG: YggS family pyridoxal phosphate-dependent enzyme [Sphingomonadaceae bacterium]|uniref:YggS family pyridoxal phosphate-dependent enzyme n=1 Tax=Thermaurantiacus sp. TaxID=2820283 RepID=UPI00298F2C45|nr:YggS family pyridoxal phosphate-dependent enzyme [Thermaurantiacus sp.]MCS6987515.1 YggS family pyridoxal phosphate-dependent enzyme [Sphingomonadaceae bacterium]MDW8415116.1 YggS family pyridoxal phosphate-dependent enzyme [Thermaurantiacus sp.]